MQDKLLQRLQELESEFEKGQTRLHELHRQQTQLHETLLRIGGAIQVLTELLEQESHEAKSAQPVPDVTKTKS